MLLWLKHCLFITDFVYELINQKTLFLAVIFDQLIRDVTKPQCIVCVSQLVVQVQSFFFPWKNEHNANETQMCCNPFVSTVILPFSSRFHSIISTLQWSPSSLSCQFNSPLYCKTDIALCAALSFSGTTWKQDRVRSCVSEGRVSSRGWKT